MACWDEMVRAAPSTQCQPTARIHDSSGGGATLQNSGTMLHAFGVMVWNVVETLASGVSTFIVWFTAGPS